MSLKTFVGQAIVDFHTIAAVAPSSRYLTQALLQPLQLGQASIVVELGAGTGAITHALLDRLPGDATLLAFEINAHFIHYLERNFSDPRLVLLHANAETLGQELRWRGCERVDAVVSSIALGYLSDQQRHALLSEVAAFLDKNSIYTQYQYIHGLQFKDGRLCRFDPSRLLRQYFVCVQRKTTWRNIPPAFVFTCHK